MTIEKHIDFWDKWVKSWFDLAMSNRKSLTTPPPIAFTFNGTSTIWPILNVFDGTNGTTTPELCWKFFPEPYWGIPGSHELHGVFINFNPGEGGHSQNINTSIEYKMVEDLGGVPLACHEIWKRYPRLSYHETINELYKKSEYATTEWMFKRRESFIKQYCKTFGHKLEGNPEFVMFELCPWHTKKVTGEVYNYIHKNIQLIDEHIIDFAFECAKKTKGPFKNLILAHGLDSDTVNNYSLLGSLTAVNEVPEKIESQRKDKEGKPWTIDVYSKPNSGIYLLNFKNSSNGFPSITIELMKIIEKYRNKN